MLEKENFNIFNYVDREEYCASMDGMRYRLKKIDSDNMEVTIWPEPYSYGKTDDSLKIKKTFPFSVEGIEEARVYLNEQYIAQEQLWKLSRS